MMGTASDPCISRGRVPGLEFDFGCDGDKGEIMTRLAYLCSLMIVVGCTTAVPTQADRDACAAAGHAPETEAFDACLQDMLAGRLERPTAAEIDELRTRMGPRR